jgi:formamidopyrimidine-DNA glycosylase
VPELPEVEVTRRELEPLLVGRTIARVLTRRSSYFFLTPPRRLARRLAGRRVLALDRVGKYLLARLDDGARLLMHLGMTGQIGAAPLDRHTHLRLGFDDGGPEVRFHDVRRFGKVQLLEPGRSSPRVDRLGPDALAIRGERLLAATRGRRAAIKTVLLDQAVLAGIGNIYADEALFLAGLRPSRRAARVGVDGCRRLAAALRQVLRQGIRAGGSTIDDYRRPDGSPGLYQEDHRVYGRAGEPCRRCGEPIRRVVIGQRSAHYCPRCQR